MRTRTSAVHADGDVRPPRKKMVATLFAQKLLQASVVELRPDKPFTWASGWLSPIYCDNRKVLSHPDLRTFVKQQLCRLVQEHFGQAQAVAGVATGAIAQGALVADALELPFAYVRPKAKDHGLQNLIEGELPAGSRVVVVEDLISTGGSSLKAVEALRAAGHEVVGMVASFTYGFDVASNAFRQAQVTLHTLTDYDTLVDVAAQSGHVKADQLAILAQWRRHPETWQNNPNPETLTN